MAENVGAIYYTVEARTAELLDAEKAVSKSMDKMSSKMSGADKSAGSLNARMNKTAAAVKRANEDVHGAESALAGLTKAMIGYLSLRSIGAVISLADAYGEMSERIRMVSKDTDEYEMIQRRLLESANATYRPIEEAQELFVRTAGTLKDLGYSTEQALDITDSFSLALVRNSASGARAESAISAMSKALQKGKVDADAWETITSAIPTIVDNLAESTGKTTAEIRALGSAGKITGAELAEAFRKGHVDNMEAAAGMAVTVKDALNNLVNTLTVYIGKTNEAYGATGKLAKAIEAVTKGVRFTAGMYTDQEKLNVLHTERASLLDKIAMREKMLVGWTKGALADKERVKQIETEMLAIQERRIAEQKKEGQSSGSGPFNEPGATGEGATDSQKRLAQMRDEIELAKLTGEARARLQAIQKLGSEATKEEREEAERLASTLFKLEEAQRQSTQSSKEDSKASSDKAKAQERDAETLAALREQLYQTTLSTDQLIARKAELMLSGYATPEQIAEVQRLNAQLAKAAELEAKRKKFGDTDAEVTQTIRGSVEPLSGGAFDDQVARYEAEAAAEQERYAAQLLRLQEAKALQLEVVGGYQAQEERMAQEHASRMAQIEQAKMQTMLSAGENGFGALSDITKNFAGEQSGLYKTMFAVSKAFAIAQSIISIQQGIAMAAANPWPTNIGAMASVAAATAGLVSNIASVSMAGGRQYGGPVAAGSMYRVNENGAPEVFNAANGRQYMLPNTRGEVVSNKDAGSDGGNMVVNIHNYTSSNVETRSDGAGAMEVFIREAKKAVANDLASGTGDVSKGMRAGWSVSRRKT